jgi:hypothetical protein
MLGNQQIDLKRSLLEIALREKTIDKTIDLIDRAQELYNWCNSDWNFLENNDTNKFTEPVQRLKSNLNG